MEHNKKYLIDKVYNIYNKYNKYTDLDQVIQELSQLESISDEKIIQIMDKYSTTTKNRCTICDIDMGEFNPRQLCKKTYCGNNFTFDEST